MGAPSNQLWLQPLLTGGQLHLEQLPAPSPATAPGTASCLLSGDSGVPEQAQRQETPGWGPLDGWMKIS